MMMMMTMISASGCAGVFVLLRGCLFQRKILTRQTAYNISIKSSHLLSISDIRHVILRIHAFYIYIRNKQACICSSNSRQEEPCDMGVTLSNNGSICCLHPAAFCYFLSPFTIMLTSAEKVFTKITKSITSASLKILLSNFPYNIYKCV